MRDEISEAFASFEKVGGKAAPPPAHEPTLVPILDNARYRRATMLRSPRAKKRHVLSLSFLAPCSRELSPVEMRTGEKAV